jgi:hypothetical protein
MEMAAGDEYRAKAAEFLAKAQTESDPKRLMELAKLAAAYERLAGQAERNMQVDLVYETGPQPATESSGDPPAETA